MKEELREGLREAEVKNILFLKIRAGGGLSRGFMVFHILSFSDTLSQPNFNSKVVSRHFLEKKKNLFHRNKVNSHETFSLDVSATSRCLFLDNLRLH